MVFSRMWVGTPGKLIYLNTIYTAVPKLQMHKRRHQVKVKTYNSCAVLALQSGKVDLTDLELAD